MKHRILCLLVIPVLCSCSMGVGKTTTREIRTDTITKEPYEVVTETEPSFWKSENQEMAFKTIDHKLTVGESLATKKLDAIDKARMERATIPLSNDARAYANALDMVMISNIKTDVNVSDIPMPRNMAETIGGQAVQLTQIATGGLGALFGVDVPIWLTGGTGGSGSVTYMDGVNIGGDAYTNGSIRKDNYDLGGYQATMVVNRNGGSVTEDNDEYTGNAQSSNGGGDGDTSTANPQDENTSLF